MQNRSCPDREPIEQELEDWVDRNFVTLLVGAIVMVATGWLIL
jgi:hypothetical protein